MKISVKTLKGNHFDLQVAEDELVTNCLSPTPLLASLSPSLSLFLSTFPSPLRFLRFAALCGVFGRWF
jgi:hypothetical protein